MHLGVFLKGLIKDQLLLRKVIFFPPLLSNSNIKCNVGATFIQTNEDELHTSLKDSQEVLFFSLILVDQLYYLTLLVMPGENVGLSYKSEYFFHCLEVDLYLK